MLIGYNILLIMKLFNAYEIVMKWLLEESYPSHGPELGMRPNKKIHKLTNSIRSGLPLIVLPTFTT